MKEIEKAELSRNTIPETEEIQRIGAGRSFGEKALLNEATRAATIICSKNCHFAVMNKAEYIKVLRKIELKT
jgi:hypothetical protein